MVRGVGGRLAIGCVWVWLASMASLVHGTVIEYRATDLADTVVGQNLYRYEYRVSGATFPAFSGFDIFFPVAEGYLFGDLESPPASPNAGWDTLSIQADPLLPHDGFYEAVALVANPSLANLFSLTFTWRGSAIPASQRFEVFDAAFQVIESGRTIPLQVSGVPEPPIWSLVAPLLGILLAGTARRRIRA